MDSFLWFDYETFGLDVARDRPVQFAGLRTNHDLIPVENPVKIYAKSTPDYLPSPRSCLITGITPGQAQERGLTEREFIERVLVEMARPGTCCVGYNNLRFDDELTRHTLYRNLLDPFAREWRDGNSRWDLLNVVRTARALRPDGLVWPRDAEGRPSLKLDLLTLANGIPHENAHDALADVRATLEVARLVKAKQPKLFSYLFDMRRKARVLELIGPRKLEPFLWVSSRMSLENLNLGLVVVVGRQPSNPNALIVYDLDHDPECLLGEVPQQAETTSPFSLLHINRAPAVAPLGTLRASDIRRLSFDLDRRLGNLERLKKVAYRKTPGYEALQKGHAQESLPDIDLALYAGGFATEKDRKLLDGFRTPDSSRFLEVLDTFDNPGYRELCVRYRARNYPDRLGAEERTSWESFCKSRMMGEGGFLSLELFRSQIGELRNEGLSPSQAQMLDDLDAYADGLVMKGDSLGQS